MRKKKNLHLRRWLEVIGSLLIMYGAYTERHVIAKSLTIIRHADTTPMFICFSLTWLLFICSALGYKILLTKPLSFWHIVLAHLAAGGPGRVIPGGAGQLSFGTLFLRKNGLTLPQSLAVALSNNLSGFVVNMSVLAVIYITDPGLFKSLHISVNKVLAVLLAIALIFMIFMIARHSKTLKNGTSNAGKEFARLWKRMRSHPVRIGGLVFIMLATIFVNSAMLYYAAHAVHIEVSLTRAFVAMSTGVALGGLIPTPGGVGGVEAGLIASMYALGMPLEFATSTALLYRFATYSIPFIPGTGAYLYLRRKKLL